MLSMASRNFSLLVYQISYITTLNLITNTKCSCQDIVLWTKVFDELSDKN